MNCRCIASWSRCNLVLCDSLRRPPRGLQSGSEKCFIILYEYLNQVYIVQTGLTPPPAMTTLAFRTTKSAAPPSLHPKLQLFSPFFFFSLCSARCYFCCLFRSHFPPVAARPSVHPFQTLQSIPFGQDSYFLSFDTNSSKKHVLRKRIRLSSWLFFFFFLLIHISASCF